MGQHAHLRSLKYDIDPAYQKQRVSGFHKEYPSSSILRGTQHPVEGGFILNGKDAARHTHEQEDTDRIEILFEKPVHSFLPHR